VTLSQIEINLNANGLSMDAMAKTYRYLDTAEMAAKKKAATPDDAPPSPPEKEGGA
jgi:Tfp pilus assembly protein PilO